MQNERQKLEAMEQAVSRHLTRLNQIAGPVMLDGIEVKREAELFRDDLRAIYAVPVASLVGASAAR